MGFSNIAKHKYSWVLNRIGCVYLKVNRWYLNKIRRKKKSTLTHIKLRMISFVFTDYDYYWWDYLQRLYCVCLVVNPNTLGEKPKVYSGTNLGEKLRLSCFNLVSEFNLITPFQQPKTTFDQPKPTLTSSTTHNHQHSKHVSQDLCNYHQSSHLYSETKNPNSTTKLVIPPFFPMQGSET